MEGEKTFYLILISIFIIYPCHGSRYSQRTCQEITIPMCKGIGYNMTYMPNHFNHDTQDEAGMEVHQFWPLVEIKCSPDLQFFLCSLYTPICVTNYHKPLPACRSVCERAKAGCAPLMRQYGFPWPDGMRCDTLPEYGDKNNLCMENVNTSTTTTTSPNPSVPPKPAVSMQSAVNLPKKPDDTGDCECACRSPLVKLDNTSNYYNKVETAGIQNCAVNCENNYFSAEADRFTIIWIGLWSFLCCISTLLTVITFIIDRERFVYPERPIIFLSACYFMVSLGYILRLIAGRGLVGCSGSTIHYSTIGPPLCTVVFVLVYFFGMAACIWWVILSLTWYLAAGLKWGQEAIASYSQYFHVIAWVIPAIKSATVIAMSGVDGDPVSGICYVGNTNTQTLWAFVLVPLFIYLILGISFLLAGFVSLVGIRNTIKQQGEQKIKKLEKLMIKIGIFSIIYTVPATVVIACHLYEQHFKDDWNATIACPCKSEQKKAGYSVFMLKYFMYHIVGITSGFWIWSSKTVTAWRRCCAKITNGKACETHDKYGAVLYRRAPRVPTPSTKSLCPSQV